jgi:hypothetical protein
MGSYRQGQIDKVLVGVPSPYGKFYRLKVTGSAADGEISAESHWVNISPQELRRIRSLLSKGD